MGGRRGRGEGGVGGRRSREKRKGGDGKRRGREDREGSNQAVC